MLGRYFLLQFKKTLKMMTFWLALCILIVSGYMIREVQKNRDGELRVLLYSESAAGEEICTRLEQLESNGSTGRVMGVSDNKGSTGRVMGEADNNSPTNRFMGESGIVFEKVADRERMQELIAKGYSNCGFVFRESFEQLSYDDFDRQVEVYQSSDSVDGYVFKEVLFPVILETLGMNITADYLEQCGISTEVITDLQLQEAMGTIQPYFAVQYVDTDMNEATKELVGLPHGQKGRKLVYAVLFVLLVILVAGNSVYANKSFYICIPKKNRWLFRLTEVFVVLLLFLPAVFLIV